MAESIPQSAAERIERAIERIEAVLAAQNAAQKRLSSSHQALRDQVRRAVAQLDGMLGNGSEP
ncbi:MAG: hypothetical protein ACKVOB_08525 [Sphingomonas sp.]